MMAVWKWDKACPKYWGTTASLCRGASFKYMCFFTPVLPQEREASSAINGADDQWFLGLPFTCFSWGCDVLGQSPHLSTGLCVSWDELSPRVVNWVFNCLIMMRLQINVIYCFCSPVSLWFYKAGLFIPFLIEPLKAVLPLLPNYN